VEIKDWPVFLERAGLHNFNSLPNGTQSDMRSRRLCRCRARMKAPTILEAFQAYLVDITIEWGAYSDTPLDGDDTYYPSEMEALSTPPPSRGP